MGNNRIVVVGGGSQFSVGLAESLIDYSRDMLAGSTVVLLDIHEEHLRIVHQYATRLAQALGVDMVFEMTTDRRQAFAGADFIINTFRPGSHREQEQDESVPPKYGLQGNETVGIGGIFMCCRVVPVLRGICADAQELCPKAWFVNYTNPTQYVADAVRRLSDLRFISLCDGYVEVGEDLGMLLGVDPDDITVYPAGSNHGMWIMRFTVKGEDGYPILRERLSQMTPDEIDRLYAKPAMVDFVGLKVKPEEIYEQFIAHYSFPFSLRLFQIYGLLPAPRYYWRYHMDQDAVIAQERSGHYVTMAGFFMRHSVQGLLGGVEERLQRASRNLQTGRRKGGGGHGDLAVRVIASMVNSFCPRATSSPTATATSMGTFAAAEISPPFSTTATSQPARSMAFTAKSAKTPATAAMGPTFAFSATSAMSLATSGLLGTATGSSVCKNRGLVLMYSSSLRLCCLMDSLAAWRPSGLSAIITHWDSLKIKGSLRRLFIASIFSGLDRKRAVT